MRHIITNNNTSISEYNKCLTNVNKYMCDFINIIKFYYNFNYLLEIDFQKILNYFNNIDSNILTNLYNYVNIIFSVPYLYLLSYVNRNNKEILTKYSLFLRKLFPELSYNHIKNKNKNKNKNQARIVDIDGNQCFSNNNNNKRIKIGFIGLFLLNNYKNSNISSVFHDRSEIIKRLDSTIFEKHLIIPCKKHNEKSSEKFKEDINNLYNSVDHIHELTNEINVKLYCNIGYINLDIIVFTDIGMDIRSNIIASMRLAPIQINTWGHSVTSGINTIDYYISSKYYELDDLNKAQEHYSEKLLALNSLCTYYLKPECEILFDKNALNLPLDRPILSCLQMPRKIDKDYLKILNKIVINNPNVVILLRRTFQNDDKIDLIKSIVYDNTKLKDNLIFINNTNHNKFLNYINTSDLILDPYPFGGCNTSFEAFSLNKIVITWPSDFLAGRFTYGFYKKMGITNPIAYSEEEYINKVSYYLNNTDEKEKLENEIKEKNHLLFNDPESVDEWEKVLLYLYDKDIKNVKI
jgi:predicted O-linked N-acetylglucosamine transferase (SPINDLY family)